MSENKGLTLDEFTGWLEEIEEQPPWRSRADREMDYYAGNQLDSEVLQRQRDLGIPPAIEPLVGPTIDAVLGMEAKTRLDWIVKAEDGADEIAEALGYELSQAERKSMADRACSDAYGSQVSVGLGWVEVSRDTDPFHFPYRCRMVHRNEIWWDWLAREPDLSDARYLIRRKWMDRKQAKLMFPGKKELIEHSGTGWNQYDMITHATDGGTVPDLTMAHAEERGWSVEELEWRDLQNNRVCLFEVWYRTWEKVVVLKTPDGRVVELDKDNPEHLAAVAAGVIQPQKATVARMNQAWFLGPHKLHDGKSPYKHTKFPYVPFWGKREDRTGKPFGLIRGMMYLQDEVNARVAKMQWGLSATRSVRTQGAVLMSDEDFNAEVARPDADIVLDPIKMRDGGVFKVERDFQLNQQQFNRLVDCREGIKRCAGVYNAFMGHDGQNKSGVAIQTLVEQSTQTLADINDNFHAGRTAVGDLLLSLIIEDMTGQQKELAVPSTVAHEAKVVPINIPAEDGHLDNDIQRIKLRVQLADAPSTPTFRAQQLTTLGGAFETMPPQLQLIALPHLLELMDIPNKQEIIEAVKQSQQQPTPEQIEEQIKQSVQMALLQKMTAQRDRDLDIKERKSTNEDIERAVKTIMSAIEAGHAINTNPAAAETADDVMALAASAEGMQPLPAPEEGAPL